MHHNQLKSIREQRILISPLNWGLGHVTRTIPVIEYLTRQNEVIICCDEQQEHLYRQYFPQMWYVPMEGYPFEFSGKGQWATDLLLHYGKLKRALRQENMRAQELANKFNADLLISDQRFGFWTPDTKNVIISHQLRLPLPSWNVIPQWYNQSLLNRFDEIWIPDDAKSTYAGRLSSSKQKKARFIGTLSRFDFKAIERYIPHHKKYDYLAIVSGPAPYNRIFYDRVVQKFCSSQKNCGIIAPSTVVKSASKPKGVTVYSDLDHASFLQLMLSSDYVVSRSGYSTLMDLNATNNRALLIPTIGQKEQEYLAQLHDSHERWQFLSEREFDKIKI